jgi:hypothetical protein
VVKPDLKSQLDYAVQVSIAVAETTKKCQRTQNALQVTTVHKAVQPRNHVLQATIKTGLCRVHVKNVQQATIAVEMRQ